MFRRRRPRPHAREPARVLLRRVLLRLQIPHVVFVLLRLLRHVALQRRGRRGDLRQRVLLHLVP